MIGGASLSGGVGSIGGTLVGVLIIGVLRNGLNLLGVSPFIQQVVIGVVIALAVTIDTLRRRPALPVKPVRQLTPSNNKTRSHRHVQPQKLLLATALAAATLTAAGTTWAKDLTIGLAVANLQADFFNQIKQSVEAEGKAKGIKVITVDAQATPPPRSARLKT